MVSRLSKSAKQSPLFLHQEVFTLSNSFFFLFLYFVQVYIYHSQCNNLINSSFYYYNNSNMIAKAQRETAAINIKSHALQKLQKINKEGGGNSEIAQKLAEELKQQERNHDFLKLEEKMKEGKGKEYKFDHKRIKEIRDRELRALQRRNQYQMQEMKKDEAQNARLRIIDHWNYKDKFRQIREKEIPQKNPFFNRSSIECYIEAVFEHKEHDEKPHPTNLPKKKHVQLLIPIRASSIQDHKQPESSDPSPISTSHQHEGSPFVFGEAVTGQISTKSGKAMFSQTNPPSPRSFHIGGNPNTDSTVEFDIASQTMQPKPYNRKAMFETLRGMDYGSVFKAQATLTQLTQYVDIETGDRQQKATMIQDVLDYLDMDLHKIKAARDLQNRSMLVKNRPFDKRNAARTQSQSAMQAPNKPTFRMPNVYTSKELPSQKAILSPRIQRGLQKSESLLARKMLQYKFVGKQRGTVY